METNKVPTSTSTSIAINPLFDPVALQAAYFTAAQLHNQLRQNSHLATAVNTTTMSSTLLTTTTTNNTHATLHKVPFSQACFPSSFLDNDRLYSLLPPQLQSCLKQQQQSISTSLAHHCSAFSPINTDLPGAATTTAPSLLTQPSSLPPIPPLPPITSSQQSLDLLLMQMQVATAATAAAGFFPAPFNVLPPVTAAALGLLAPQFRMLQLAEPNFSPYSASTNTNVIFTPDNKDMGDKTAIEIYQSQVLSHFLYLQPIKYKICCFM